jgi:hypothetical protein
VHPIHLLASHHAAHPPAGWLALLALTLAAGWYALACAAMPWRDCWHCGGDGRNGPGARSACKHCEGTGRAVRYGRRAYTHLTRTRGVARRADAQRAREVARRAREQANPWKDPR